MAYIVSPGFGMQLADPATIQAFETPVVNANFTKLEDGILVEQARITAGLAEIDVLQAGVGRGNLARESVVTPANLSAIADGIIGDKVLVTTPGTGVSPFWAEMYSGAGATADWRPAETIVVDTLANLTTFIAAWIADTDLTFKVGQEILLSTLGLRLQVTSTAGAYKALPDQRAIATVSGTGVAQGADGVIVWTNPRTASPLVVDACFPTLFRSFRIRIWGESATTASLTMVLRSTAPADVVTASSYMFTENLGRNGASSSSTPAGAASWAIGNTNRVFSLDGIMDLANVALPTTWLHTLGSTVIPQVLGVTSLVDTIYRTQGDATIMGGFKLTISADVTAILYVAIEGVA